MPIDPDLVAGLNAGIDRLKIDERRWPELALELDQLREAAERALAAHDFDRDPAEFAGMLAAERGGGRSGR